MSKLSEAGCAGAPDRPPGRPSDGLALAVTFVLCQHGWPALNEGQRFELRLHLSHLLHGEPGTPCPGQCIT